MKMFYLEGNRVKMNDIVIGEIKRTPAGVIYKTIRRAKHFMVKAHGFGVSMAVLKLLYGWVSDVVIEYTGKWGCYYYIAKVEDFLESDIAYVDNTFVENDLQKFLPLERFIVKPVVMR